MRRWTRWLIAGIAALFLVAVVAPWVYLRFIKDDAPPPLTLGGSTTTSPAGASEGATGASSTVPTTAADGDVWVVADGSIVGYRVNEVVFGQSAEAVGRTSDITGSMTVEGATVTSASFTVDMTTVTSDESRRDDQFNDRIMETSTYPTATFTLTEPIDLGSIPPEGEERTYEATGDLTLHGVTRSVTFEVAGRRTASAAEIVGSIPITFADHGIENPSFGPVTTEDHGLLEFAIVFTPS
jgi:polyisoprenoid-binding protein YceI